MFANHAVQTSQARRNLKQGGQSILLKIEAMLNKRDELLKVCRHRRKHLLVSLIKPPDEEEPPDTIIK